MSKKIFKKPRKIQSIYFLLIFISGGIIFYIKTLPEKEQNIWVMLVLLAILMYALLKSTKNWAYDNPKREPDDAEKPEYKEQNIPSLEEMIKKNKKNK